MAIKNINNLKIHVNGSHNIKKVCVLSFVAVDKDILYWGHMFTWQLL